MPITGDLHRKNSERRKAPRSSVEQSTRFEFVLASRLLRMRSEWRPQRTRDSEQFRRQADPGEPGAAGGVKAARRLREKAMVDMKRRDFIRVAGGVVVAWPLAAGAPQGKDIPRIRLLLFAKGHLCGIDPFIRGLAALGYID